MAGRPTSFKPEYIEQVEKLCKLGLTDVEMAEVFGVSETTFNTWKKKQPQFLLSIKRGKAVADGEVADKLYKRAVGYEVKEVTREKNKSGKLIITKEVTKHIAPDTGAQCFWLKNRQPEKWRDKHEVDSTIKHDMEFTLDIE